jgi:hypothetical protein
MGNLPESRRHAPVNSVFRTTTACMRSATAREEYAPHGALCLGAGQMGSNDLPPYAPSTPEGKPNPYAQVKPLPRASAPHGQVRVPASAAPVAAPCPGAPRTTARPLSDPARPGEGPRRPAAAPARWRSAVARAPRPWASVRRPSAAGPASLASWRTRWPRPRTRRRRTATGRPFPSPSRRARVCRRPDGGQVPPHHRTPPLHPHEPHRPAAPQNATAGSRHRSPPPRSHSRRRRSVRRPPRRDGRMCTGRLRTRGAREPPPG